MKSPFFIFLCVSFSFLSNYGSQGIQPQRRIESKVEDESKQEQDDICLQNFVVASALMKTLTKPSDPSTPQPKGIQPELKEKIDVADDPEENGRRASYGAASEIVKALAQPVFNRPPVARSRSRGNDCYACVDCPHVQVNKTNVKTCPYQNSRCVEYAEMYSYQKRPLYTYVRGCVLERGSCEDIQKVHSKHDSIKLLYCSECAGDRCNSNGVARSLPDLAAAIFFLIVTPLITKYSFS